VSAEERPRLDLWRTALAVVGVIVVVALIGAVVALIRGRSVSAGIALAYYLVGSAIILAGSAPRGGFSLLRGRWSERRPTGGGSFALEGILLGLLLIGLGVLLDVTRPL
jgi:Na+/melibiose symporter-like transporter